MATAYILNDLINACGGIKQVVVLSNAQISAREDFGLTTQKDVIDFIYNDGLESPHHINTTTWKNNPNQSCLIQVDAYSFYSGPKHGYMAFFFSPMTNKWLIKSFKLNKDALPRNNNMNDQLFAIKALMKRNCGEIK
ncbi:MAG: hypothetical protein WAW61_20130 [Methylococcaceae bacterium]